MSKFRYSPALSVVNANSICSLKLFSIVGLIPYCNMISFLNWKRKIFEQLLSYEYFWWSSIRLGANKIAVYQMLIIICLPKWLWHQYILWCIHIHMIYWYLESKQRLNGSKGRPASLPQSYSLKMEFHLNSQWKKPSQK